MTRHTPSGQIPPPERVADGTRPGTERVIGQRVSVTYPWVHQRKDAAPITETRHAIGRITSILPDGALWVVTDRDGGVRVEAQNCEAMS